MAWFNFFVKGTTTCIEADTKEAAIEKFFFSYCTIYKIGGGE
jgi:hypothetical protein